MSADTQPSTRVDFTLASNVWWDDALQLGDPDDFTWTLNGTSFYLTITTDDDNLTPLVALSTSILNPLTNTPTILIVDAVNRIIQFNATDAQLIPVVPRGKPYRYDLLMVNNASGQTDAVAHGEIKMHQGITKGPN